MEGKWFAGFDGEENFLFFKIFKIKEEKRK
jgi:hypothetical protein